MPRTILCPQCGLILSIPEGAAGRRLKCPKCAARFPADPGAPPKATSSPELRASPPTPAGTRQPGPPASPQREVARPAGARADVRRFDEDVEIQTNEAPLRELFAAPSSAESSASSTPMIPASPAEADAAALFKDEEPQFKRKPLPAEGRSSHRRCPTCSSVVPVGMSLCQRCGLNLDTGERFSLDDDLLPVSAPRIRTPPPFGVMIVGGLGLVASIVFAVVSIVMLSNGNQGAPFLLLTCLFGIFASTQYLRAKSSRYLVIALSLGAMFAVVSFIALPIYDSTTQIELAVEGEAGAGEPEPGTEGELGAFQEQIDFSRISWGIASLLGYAAMVLYINSPQSKRYFTRKAD